MTNKYDDQDAHAVPVLRKDRQTGLAEEQETGGHFEGESLRERKVGIDREVVVDLFQRRLGNLVGTFYVRVSLRSQVRYARIYRTNVDLDRYVTEGDFLNMVAISAGALAETDNERGANWDTEYVARRAREGASEIFNEVNDTSIQKG